MIKREVLQEHQPDAYREWLRADGEYNITVTFPDFVNYFISMDKDKINPHLKPAINTCHPCRIRYDFYGNFRHFGTDVKMVTDFLGISFTWYRNKSLHSSGRDTKTYLPSYYNRLNGFQRSRLMESLKDELDFYYVLYPHERESDLLLLGNTD